MTHDAPAAPLRDRRPVAALASGGGANPAAPDGGLPGRAPFGEGDAPADRPRRRRLVGALALSTGLAACGFRLRGTQTLPFDTVFIDAPPTSAIGPELASTIRSGASTQVVDSRDRAKAVVQIMTEARDRDVLSVDAQGRAREFRSRLRVVFRVTDGKAREYLGPTTINAARDLAVREEQLLAREYEEAQLYQDMLIDVAQQMLRRLAAIKV